MRVLIVGSSHVDNLGLKGDRYFDHEKSVYVHVEFYGRRGATYETYTRNNNHLLRTLANWYNPKIIVSILGGNNIKVNVTNQQIYQAGENYYRALKETFPNALIVASQIEARFYEEGNKFNSPVGREWFRRRNAVNNFIKALRYKDHILMIAGPGRLDNIKYYMKDGVHLTPDKYETLYYYIRCTIVDIIKKHNIQY